MCVCALCVCIFVCLYFCVRPLCVAVACLCVRPICVHSCGSLSFSVLCVGDWVLCVSVSSRNISSWAVTCY